MKRIVAVAALLAAGVCAQAVAPPKAADVVHYRQNLMSVIGWNFNPLTAMAKARQPFDAKEFATRAERIRFLSAQILEGFANGPDDGGVVNDASPDIWTDNAGFRARLDDFIAQAKALDDAARSGDEAKMKIQFQKTDDSCKTCHDKYKSG